MSATPCPVPARCCSRPAWPTSTRTPPRQSTSTDDDRAPLLLIAGGKDHIAPASVTKANYNLYKKSKAITDYKEFPERSHYTLGQPGWEEVAGYALDWAVNAVTQAKG
jgi:alpha-beta hydrolase superfamily lysophospholipase